LPGTSVLGTLSDGDAQKLCTEAGAFLSGGSFKTTFSDFSCKAAGIEATFAAMAKTDADLQASCKTAYDACVAMPSDPTSMLMCDKRPTAACTATVAEYSACLNDTTGFLTTADASLPSCSSLTMANLATSLAAFGQLQSSEPASCKTLDQKCPGAMGAM